MAGRLAVCVVALLACASAVQAVPMARLRAVQAQLTGRSGGGARSGAGSTQAVHAPARDPKHAVEQVRAYDKSLGLDAKRQAAKEQLLASDPFVFFRATPRLFHLDVGSLTHAHGAKATFGGEKNAHSSAALLYPMSAPIRELATGNDVHAANFGTFRAFDESGAAADGVFFGMNDHDQCSQQKVPLDVDLTRFATSIVLAARAIGAPAVMQTALVNGLFDGYFEEIDELTKDGPKRPFIRLDKAKGAVKRLLQDATDAKRKDFIAKSVVGGAKFGGNKDVVPLDAVKDKALIAELKTVLPLGLTAADVLDVAQRLNSGGSSFGLPRYWVLTRNPTDATKQPWIFEVKQLLPGATTLHADATDAAALSNAHRTLMGGTFQQTVRYVTLKSGPAAGKACLVREVEPEKDSLNLAKASVDDLNDLVAAAAKVLARAHSAGGKPAIAHTISAWIPAAQRAAAKARLIAFAAAYADQVAADHAAYRAALAAPVPAASPASASPSASPKAPAPKPAAVKKL